MPEYGISDAGMNIGLQQREEGGRGDNVARLTQIANLSLSLSLSLEFYQDPSWTPLLVIGKAELVEEHIVFALPARTRDSSEISDLVQVVSLEYVGYCS